MKKSLIFLLNCFLILFLKAGEATQQPVNYPISSVPYVQVKPHAISEEVAKECEKQSNGEQDLENKCLCEKCWEECLEGRNCKTFCKCSDPKETGTWEI